VKPVKKKEPTAPAPIVRKGLDPALATNLITALVFLSVGFVAGYVFKSQTAPTGVDAQPGTQSSANAAQGASSASASTASGDALPPGHPPIDTGPEVQAMEQQAAANPQDPGPPLKLANFLYDQGNFQEAITWYEKAMALDPRNVDASTDLGTCYFNVGRPDDALKQFRHSLAVQPAHQPTLFNIIVVNMEGKHDYKAAKQAYDALYRLNPDYPKLSELKKTLDEESGSASGQP
jgi:tetratricopeptide (TPR) repeat protein